MRRYLPIVGGGSISGRSADIRAFRNILVGGAIAPLSVIACLAASSPALAQEMAQQGASSDSGQQVFNNLCRTCHSTREGDNRLGPHLHKLIGRKAGSLPNYRYSDAMNGAGFAWDERTLDRFIANPSEVVPGNKMTPYGGVSSAATREKIIVFLKSLSTDH